MSIAATNWVWALTDLPNATVKLVLMKHADHAHDDGTHTWQSIETIARYALCSERTAQRANAWLIEHGYLREGDQGVIPAHYDKRRLPIAYELAMTEVVRQEWEALSGSGSNAVRSKATAVGSKGGKKSAQVRWGDNVSPQESTSNGEGTTGDNLSPQDSDSRGDNQGQSGVTETASWGDTGVTQTTQQPPLEANPPSSSLAEAADDAPTAPADAVAETSQEKTEKSKRGTRLPADFAPDQAMREWVLQECPHFQNGDATREHAKFVDYWVSIPGQRGVRLDWVATWRNWMRKASDDRAPRGGGRFGAEPRQAYDDQKTWGQHDPAAQPETNDEDLDAVFGKRGDPRTGTNG